VYKRIWLLLAFTALLAAQCGAPSPLPPTEVPPAATKQPATPLAAESPTVEAQPTVPPTVVSSPTVPEATPGPLVTPGPAPTLSWPEALPRVSKEDWSRGPSDARVVWIEYADFQ
jgi:hypothetical protein